MKFEALATETLAILYAFMQVGRDWRALRRRTRALLFGWPRVGWHRFEQMWQAGGSDRRDSELRASRAEVEQRIRRAGELSEELAIQRDAEEMREDIRRMLLDMGCPTRFFNEDGVSEPSFEVVVKGAQLDVIGKCPGFKVAVQRWEREHGNIGRAPFISRRGGVLNLDPPGGAWRGGGAGGSTTTTTSDTGPA